MTAATGSIIGTSWAGVEKIDFVGYEAVLPRFRREVEALWEQEDETR